MNLLLEWITTKLSSDGGVVEGGKEWAKTARLNYWFMTPPPTKILMALC